MKLAVFASGRGSNFLSILQAMDRGELKAEPVLLISNNPRAGALDSATERGIPARVIQRSDFNERDAFIAALLEVLKAQNADFIALAGYMKKIPREVIRHFPNRMLNIHPALLPSFGGKGLYGHHVHQAVLEQGCKVSGATVHIVNHEYDRGPIVLQECVPVLDDDTADDLATRVLKVEHALFPRALALFAEDRARVKGNRVYIQ